MAPAQPINSNILSRLYAGLRVPAPSHTLGALYPDVEWTHTLDVAKVALAVYKHCECSAEDDVGYRGLVLHALKRLNTALSTLQDR